MTCRFILLPVQYLSYVAQVLRGDLGTSLTTHESVAQEFATLFPATVELAFFALDVFSQPARLTPRNTSNAIRDKVPD